jgi:hypothetical protein
MTFDPKTNRIQFGLMTDDEKAALKNCGGPWELLGKPPSFAKIGAWHKTFSPAFFPSGVYRQIAPVIIPASVNWSCFGPDIVAVAADEDGGVFAFKKLPKPNNSDWYGPGFPIRVTGNFPPHAYIRGADIWQNSLVVRP